MMSRNTPRFSLSGFGLIWVIRKGWTLSRELQDDIFEAFSEYGDIKNLRAAQRELFGVGRGGGSSREPVSRVQES